MEVTSVVRTTKPCTVIEKNMEDYVCRVLLVTRNRTAAAAVFTCHGLHRSFTVYVNSK